MKIKTILFGLIFGVSLSFFAQDQIHTDTENNFSVIMPEEWAVIGQEGRMVWHVASNNGTELPDCGVIVTADSSFQILTQEDYASSASETKMTKLLSMSFSDVAIGFWETEFPFADQTALHYVYSGTLEGIRQTSMGMQTIHNGKLYNFFCNAEADKFPLIYVDLLNIAISFKFLEMEKNKK